jgi:hypothetical protein
MPRPEERLVSFKGPVALSISDASLHAIKRTMLEVGRTLQAERSDGFRYAVKLIEEELLHEGSSGVARWRIERVLDKLRDHVTTGD